MQSNKKPTMHASLPVGMIHLKPSHDVEAMLDALKLRNEGIDADIKQLRRRHIRLARSTRRIEVFIIETLIAPVYKLPSEIILEILRWYLPADGFLHLPLRWKRPNPLRFAHICSQWRSVAFATPSLWAHIHLVVPWSLDEKEASKLAELAQFSIQLSANHSIRFRLSVFPILGLGESEPLRDVQGISFRSLLASLFVHCHRWKELSMDISYRALTYLFSENPHSTTNLFSPDLHTPRLESFELTDGFSLDEDILHGQYFRPAIAFLHAPSLRKVVLNRIPLSDIAFPWEQVEELSLRGLDLDECLNILRHCDQLKCCTLSDTLNTGDSSAAHVFLEELEDLHILEMSELDGVADICHKLTCPNLRNGTFRSQVLVADDIDASSIFWMRECLKTFLSRCPKIVGLHLWNLPLNENGLLEVVKASTTITHLSISSAGSLQSIGNQVLYELTLIPPLADDDWLPYLEYVHIGSRVCADHFVADFIESRWFGNGGAPANLKEVHLDLHGRNPSAGFHSRLAGLYDEGLKVVVIGC
jgi:hypothetical protein